MSVKRHRCQTLYRRLQAHDPHTHLAHLIPNQRTLTCRSINDLVSKQPAYPQIEDILRGQPFLSPIEQAYLEPCNTTRCEAETLFHNSFTTKVHLLRPHTQGQDQAHQRSSSLSAPEADTYSRLTPSSPPDHPLVRSFQLSFM
jgi:hypothetical protein